MVVAFRCSFAAREVLTNAHQPPLAILGCVNASTRNYGRSMLPHVVSCGGKVPSNSPRPG